MAPAEEALEFVVDPDRARLVHPNWSGAAPIVPGLRRPVAAALGWPAVQLRAPEAAQPLGVRQPPAFVPG